MTISVKILNDQIKKISDSNTLLDMLLEFEKTLDDMEIYAYQNWEHGEVLEGPYLGRHYLTVKLLYPQSQMPDPAGAQRLMGRDCLVRYKKSTLLTPKKVRNFDDLIAEQRPDGSMRYRAKTNSEPVWVVEIRMPRRYVDEFNSEYASVDEDNYVDLEAVGTDAQLQAGTPTTPNTETTPDFGGPI